MASAIKVERDMKWYSSGIVPPEAEQDRRKKIVTQQAVTACCGGHFELADSRRNVNNRGL